MKRFRSRFGAIQRLREQQEKMAALAMMEAINSERVFSEKYAMLSRRHTEAVNSVDSLMNGRLESGNLTSARNSIIGAEQNASRAKAELQRAQMEVAAAATARTTAYQRLESVEKAKEREAAEHRRQVQAADLATRIDNIRIHDVSPVAAELSRTARKRKDQS